MAQEINEELGRCLRERGVIGEVLDGVEKKTKLKREQVVYGECTSPERPGPFGPRTSCTRLIALLGSVFFGCRTVRARVCCIIHALAF